MPQGPEGEGHRGYDRRVSGIPSDEFPLGYRIARLDRAFVSNLDRGLARFGLTSQRFGVLLFLRDEPGLTSAELARRAIVTPQTMIRIVAGLEAAGLVERRQGARDGRSLPVRVTPLGLRQLDDANAWVEQVEAELIRGEDDDDVRRAQELLSRATRRMDELRP